MDTSVGVDLLNEGLKIGGPWHVYISILVFYSLLICWVEANVAIILLMQIKLSLPGLVIVEAEFLAFEMLTLFSSYFGTAHLAAQSVLVTATSITFQLSFALSIASSTRVANFLGATLGDAAKVTANTGLIAAGFIGLFNFCLLAGAKSYFVLLFTNDPKVIEYVVQVMPLTALFQCVDSFACMGGGLLRGQGIPTASPPLPTGSWV